MRMVPVEDVLFFQAEDKYTKVVTADAEALIKKPIKELFEELDPEAFWQIHPARSSACARSRRSGATGAISR